VSRARFIAGATCTACGSLDRIVVEETGGGFVKRCVACGDEETLVTQSSGESRGASKDARIIARAKTTRDG
jgi:uncharacterized metal-binding protein (TIGR02443 family)